MCFINHIFIVLLDAPPSFRVGLAKAQFEKEPQEPLTTSSLDDGL